LAFYTFVPFGRGNPTGYGPRYLFPCIVPMAMGTGVVLAEAWAAAQTTLDSGASRSGPAAVCATALTLGVMRLALLLYPPVFSDVRAHNRLQDAIAKSKLHGAVVFAEDGISSVDSRDLTEDLPLELYPDQDVIIAIDRRPESLACVRELYPGRPYYRATPGDPVKLSPL
jgi:hypothetical protein